MYNYVYVYLVIFMWCIVDDIVSAGGNPYFNLEKSSVLQEVGEVN